MSDINEFKSIEELRNNKLKWNLISDLKLLGLLKNTNEDFARKIQQKLTEFENLNYQTNSVTNKINNLITSILILTNTKFIENRVYDEDIKDIATSTSVTKNSVNDPVDDEQKLIARLENSINEAVKQLSNKYGITGQDLADNNNYNLLHTLYLQKNKFVHKNLPYIIGSDEFLKDTFVGLKDEKDDQHINFHTQLDNDYKESIDTTDQCNDIKPVETNDDEEENLLNGPLTNPLATTLESNDDLFIPVKPPKSIVDELKDDIKSNNSNRINKIENEKIDFIFDQSSDEEENIFTRPVIKKSLNTDNKLNKNLIVNNNEDDDDDANDFLFNSNLVNNKTDLTPKEINDVKFNSVPQEQVKSFTNNSVLLDNDSENDSDDIFNTKVVSKPSVKTKETFFSSDDDDDDFFTNIIKTKEKSTTEKSSNFDQNQSTIKSPDKIPEIKPRSKNVNNETENKPKLSPKFVPNNNIEKLSAKPEFTNVINKLNSVLQKTTLKEDNNRAQMQNEIKNEIVSPQPKENSTVDNEFNSILKYKSKLNANRARKPPSRTHKASLKTDNSNDIVLDISDDEFDQQRIEDNSTNTNIKPSSILEKSESIVKSDKINILSNTEIINHEEVIAKPLNEPIVIDKPKPMEPIKSSIFDSDDSDDDIFKDSSIFKSKTKQPPLSISSVSAALKPKSIFLNDDDDDDLNFISPFNTNSNPKNTTIKPETKQQENPVENNKPTTQLVKKSIFDDDDSDDDLFKF